MSGIVFIIRYECLRNILTIEFLMVLHSFVSVSSEFGYWRIISKKKLKLWPLSYHCSGDTKLMHKILNVRTLIVHLSVDQWRESR